MALEVFHLESYAEPQRFSVKGNHPRSHGRPGSAFESKQD